MMIFQHITNAPVLSNAAHVSTRTVAAGKSKKQSLI